MNAKKNSKFLSKNTKNPASMTRIEKLSRKKSSTILNRKTSLIERDSPKRKQTLQIPFQQSQLSLPTSKDQGMLSEHNWYSKINRNGQRQLKGTMVMKNKFREPVVDEDDHLGPKLDSKNQMKISMIGGDEESRPYLTYRSQITDRLKTESPIIQKSSRAERLNAIEKKMRAKKEAEIVLETEEELVEKQKPDKTLKKDKELPNPLNLLARRMKRIG